jgi:hypothetical protein
MSKNLKWSINNLKQKGLVQNSAGDYVKVESLVAKGKVVKKISILETTEGVTYNPNARINRVDPDLLIQVPAANRKVKNATKIEEHGVKFDSLLEKYMYNVLKGAQIDFEFQKVFILQPKFKYRTENIRAIYKVVDFWIESKSIIIDTKGWANDVSPMKHKMLKYALLNDYGIEPEIFMPSNKKECDLLLNRLLFG